jgi:hypothetical protein
MKKVILTAAAVFAFGFANAQDKNGGQTSEGKWLIEANTGFGAAHSANTGFQFASSDGSTAYNLGAEAGYFIIDNLALKAGLGFGGVKPDGGDSVTSFSYKIGAKYYVIDKIPVQVDYSGASVKGADENPSYVGFQAGYALFLGENVSIEPGIRYNVSTNKDFNKDVFQLNIGFALHF